MRIILVRHAHTIEHEKGLVRGQNHGSLSKLGLKQAEKLAEYLKNFKIDLIYSSDLERCKQTLAPLLINSNLHATYTSKLRERNYGVFDGMSKKSLTDWRSLNNGAIPDGGETAEDLKNRIFSFIGEEISKWTSKDVLIMAHGGSISKIIEFFFKKNLTNDVCPLAGITIIEYFENCFNLISSYDDSYLMDLKFRQDSI